MKTTLICLLFCCLCLQSLKAQESNLSKFEIRESGSDLSVSVKLSARPGNASKIKVPTEGVFFSVDVPRDLQEANLFSSGMAIDLNGDGDTNDVLNLRRTDGREYIDDIEVKPFSSNTGWQRTGQANVYQVQTGAPKFIVYQTQGELVAGIEYNGNEAGFVEYNGPFLQVLLVESCSDPSGAAQLILEGAEHTVFAFEPGMFEPTRQWHRIQWMAVPANRLTQFKISGIGNGLLVLAVNEAPAEGVRKRDVKAVRPIVLPFARNPEAE